MELIYDLAVLALHALFAFKGRKKSRKYLAVWTKVSDVNNP